jgi:hypothetical protein
MDESSVKRPVWTRTNASSTVISLVFAGIERAGAGFIHSGSQGLRKIKLSRHPDVPRKDISPKASVVFFQTT